MCGVVWYYCFYFCCSRDWRHFKLNSTCFLREGRYFPFGRWVSTRSMYLILTSTRFAQQQPSAASQKSRGKIAKSKANKSRSQHHNNKIWYTLKQYNSNNKNSNNDNSIKIHDNPSAAEKQQIWLLGGAQSIEELEGVEQ